MFEYCLLLFFPALMILAGVLDMLTMTIPNRISFVLVGGFFVVAIATGMSLSDVAVHFAVGFGILAIGIVFFAFGWCGGGDAKLLAASSLWMGLDFTFSYVLHVGLFGGALAIAILLYRSFVPAFAACRINWMYRLHCSDSGVPYGIAIACGALAVFPGTAVFQSLTS